MPVPTPEESFLLQAYALAECYEKLGKLETKKYPILIKNEDKIFGEIGKQRNALRFSVFQGQGVVLSVFYMFLVLPFEWKKKKVGDFDKLDLSGAEKIANKEACVKKDTYTKKDIALKHFRNALAHGRLGWENGNLVVEDINKEGTDKEEQYTAQYSTYSLGLLAESLRSAIHNYFETKART